MYDFKKDLLKDENIIYTCRPTPGKGNKQIKESIFLFILATLTQIILFVVSKTKNDLTLDTVPIALWDSRASVITCQERSGSASIVLIIVDAALAALEK